jgi:hypothetical protein
LILPVFPSPFFTMSLSLHIHLFFYFLFDLYIFLSIPDFSNALRWHDGLVLSCSAAKTFSHADWNAHTPTHAHTRTHTTKQIKTLITSRATVSVCSVCVLSVSMSERMCVWWDNTWSWHVICSSFLGSLSSPSLQPYHGWTSIFDALILQGWNRNNSKLN